MLHVYSCTTNDKLPVVPTIKPPYRSVHWYVKLYLLLMPSVWNFWFVTCVTFPTNLFLNFRTTHYRTPSFLCDLSELPPASSVLDLFWNIFLYIDVQFAKQEAHRCFQLVSANVQEKCSVRGSDTARKMSPISVWLNIYIVQFLFTKCCGHWTMT